MLRRFDSRRLGNILEDVKSLASAVAPKSRPILVRVIVLLLLYSTVASFAVSEFIRYPGRYPVTTEDNYVVPRQMGTDIGQG